MFEGIFNLITDIISGLVDTILNGVYSGVLTTMSGSNDLLYEQFSFYLFSDNLIFSMAWFDLIVLITTTIFLVIIIRFLIKTSYNLVKKVFGVFKI